MKPIKITISLEQIADVCETARCDYWAIDAKWTKERHGAYNLPIMTHIQEDDSREWHKLDWQRAADMVSRHPSLIPSLVDSGEGDAYSCDAIIQLAAFGEIRYA